MTEPAGRDPGQVFAGYALVTVGALILGLSGLCTLYFGGLSLFSDLQRGSYGSFFGILPSMLVIGGVPMLVGFGLLRWGLSLLRRKLRRPPSAPPPG